MAVSVCRAQIPAYIAVREPNPGLNVMAVRDSYGSKATAAAMPTEYAT